MLILHAYMMQGDDDFYVDLKNEIREEVEKFGDVEVLTVFEVSFHSLLGHIIAMSAEVNRRHIACSVILRVW